MPTHPRKSGKVLPCEMISEASFSADTTIMEDDRPKVSCYSVCVLSHNSSMESNTAGSRSDAPDVSTLNGDISNADELNTADLTVTEAAFSGEASRRIDRWISAQMPHLSRSRIQGLIEDGRVLVNGERCTTKKQAVAVGDRLSITIPDVQPLSLKPEAIPLDILVEDGAMIIINKPAGMVVHPAPGHDSGTLVHALLAHCPDLAGIGGVERPGIVHRLDKDTTGAIVVAKTERAMQSLQAQIRAKEARREYLAVVYGAPAAPSGTVNKPIGRHPTDRKKMAIVPVEKWGRTAITHWHVKERLGNYTLMQFQLETGRTHQIRVHCAEMGHPIVGDPIYSSGRSLGINLPGQALHAWRLTVRHPLTEEWIEAIAPLPQHFERLLQVLRRRL